MVGHGRHVPRRSGVSAVLTVCVLAWAAACSPPPVGSVDPQIKRYNLTVENKTFAMAVKLAPDGGPANVKDAARIRDFIGEYLRSGRTSMRIATPPTLDADATRARAGAVRAHLVSEGVRAGSIEVLAGMAPVDDIYAVVLTYRGSAAKIPECGDWSGNAGFNPTNQPHTDHGCAYQRNLGLMLSDPGDLVRSRGAGSPDAANIDRVFRLWREGEPTAVGAEEEGTASEASE